MLFRVMERLVVLDRMVGLSVNEKVFVVVLFNVCLVSCESLFRFGMVSVFCFFVCLGDRIVFCSESVVRLDVNFI